MTRKVKRKFDAKTAEFIGHLKEKAQECDDRQKVHLKELDETWRERGSLAGLLRRRASSLMQAAVSREWYRRCIETLTKDESNATMETLYKWLEHELLVKASNVASNTQPHDLYTLEAVAELVRSMRDRRDEVRR